MKLIRTATLLFLIILVIVSCTTESDKKTSVSSDPVSYDSGSQSLSPNAGGEDREVLINPNRGYYDVVIVDEDHWEICLNYSRIRNNCTSFYGHLWYQAGQYTFEGTAGAVYDPARDMLTVTALDSGWDRGHIVYSLEFEGDSNNMNGVYVYYEYTRRVNTIDAWLDQGIIGGHDAGPYPGKAVAGRPSFPPPSEHPKKARFIDDLK